ncbi:MAG: AAA family ATPase [Actinobacteria bacterium]|nr:AAA family ATPase [Actinomycetota bacterium]
MPGEQPTLRIERDLLDPSRPGVVERDTHVSRVIFTGDVAHKWKKPVRFAFVDQSTIDRRAELCRLEVELNRRFSPDVYLGVEEIVDGAGNVIDHAVLMRRMPEDRRLATLIRHGADVSTCITQIASIVASRHADALRSDEIASVATPEGVWDLWDRNLREMAPFVPAVVEASALAQIGALARRFLDGRHGLLADRIARGQVVDGHGDLLADDIFCLDDGPRILDCLEFDERLRWGDVVLDIGFLAMDLEHLGRPDLARLLLDAYVSASGERHPVSLEHHYIAYRALVRAKVSCLKGSAPDLDEARRYLDQCVTHLQLAQLTIVVVGGLPATGKSTLAAALAERLGWALLRSDEVRKVIAGLAPGAHRPAAYREGLYDDATTDRTYAAMLDAARDRLAQGENVILDASFARQSWRAAAAAVADGSSASLVQLRCVLPAELAEARLAARAARGIDPSDADLEVARRMSHDFDPWTDAAEVDTRSAVDDLVATLCRRDPPTGQWVIRP